MAGEIANPLLSNQTSSDSGLQVILHPLPILCISDRITRSSVRGQSGPIVVALLGQQNGREIVIEESFDCKVEVTRDGETKLDPDWFNNRLEQMKLVYKQPQLDLVGWGTLFPVSGPTSEVLTIHKFLLSTYNESAILLGFHPQNVLNPISGKLPITIYESNYEADGSGRETHTDGEDREMKDGDAALTMQLKFRELPYSIETGEAEMIGMAFVHKGAANATAAAADAAGDNKAITVEADVKSKRRVVSHEEEEEEEKPPLSDNAVLSHEDQDLLAALSSKKNAIQMLKKRVDLFISYLEQLPATSANPEHLPAVAEDLKTVTALTPSAPSNNVTRAMQALKTNLTLLIPGPQSRFEEEMLREANDVNLVSLLGDVLQSISEVREVGQQFSIVEGARAHKMRLAEFGGAAASAAAFNLQGPGDILH